MKKTYAVLIVLGILVLAAATKGAMDYTSRSEFCAACHVMEGQYERWEHSSHKEWAGCSDCHVPHDNIVNMMLTKSIDGLGHVYHFTFKELPDQIKIKERSIKNVEQNCLRCHQGLMEGVDIGDRTCWDCHRGLPHGFLN